MEVERTAEGSVRQPGRPNLAGSALCLDQAVRNVCAWKVASFEDAIAMASANPRRALARPAGHYGLRLDAGRLRWNSALEPAFEGWDAD